MQIRILVTGGTFDKKYDELTGKLFFQDTHVQEMLRLGRARLQLSVETAMMIDSLEMDDAGRAQIVARCRAAVERAIVVTHGTDTMVETARAVAAFANSSAPEAAGVSGKTVETHRSEIMRRLDIHDLGGLIRLGMRLGLVSVI